MEYSHRYYSVVFKKEYLKPTIVKSRIVGLSENCYLFNNTGGALIATRCGQHTQAELLFLSLILSS